MVRAQHEGTLGTSVPVRIPGEAPSVQSVLLRIVFSVLLMAVWSVSLVTMLI